MVSWDIKAKFSGLSPHIQELLQLAREQKFSNIEEIRWNGDRTHTFRTDRNSALSEVATEGVLILEK